ncbi:hypothetical protein IP93_01396 [Lysobacter ruishenii]|uniref:Uncharacterized protein n=2 Tax=Aerolutibacter ruishenii TaxID=686800 RepID=A0A562LV25_9GAMM|nr:hypothetical protein IP93_01396 [Lysobacter ruishenii]
MLNQGCRCEVADVESVRNTILAAIPATKGADPTLRAHLFSPYALFVDRPALELMGAVARTVFEVADNARYVERALANAPAIARHDLGSTGGILGLDFHLTTAGPRLIEINTNPGGLLLNALLLDAVKSCAPLAWIPWTSGADARALAIAAWLDDLQAQLGRMPGRLALVDVAPCDQFLHPEFELYATGFRERNVDTVILDPSELVVDGSRLRDTAGGIDAIYNRLTDFALASPECAPLAAAYLDRQVALTPHPRAHAVFADKRNLEILGDAALLESWGVNADTASLLAGTIPRTQEMKPHDRDTFWRDRGRYFFKPAAGYGSRGSYRGDKLTRKTWEAMAAIPYVAQEVAPPGTRILHDGVTFKADVRCFASERGVILFSARLYQGQTTNMRTPGGGFATVLTTPA